MLANAVLVYTPRPRAGRGRDIACHIAAEIHVAAERSHFVFRRFVTTILIHPGDEIP